MNIESMQHNNNFFHHSLSKKKCIESACITKLILIENQIVNCVHVPWLEIKKKAQQRAIGEVDDIEQI